jgi:transposase
MAAPVRLMVTDAAWQAIVIELDRGNHTAGCPPPRDRRVMEVVCAVVRRGLPGREWPKAFGTGDAMSSQVCRGEKRRVWRRLWEGLPGEGYTRAKTRLLDRTLVCTHPQATGAPQKTMGRRHRLWGVFGVG